MYYFTKFDPLFFAPDDRIAGHTIRQAVSAGPTRLFSLGTNPGLTGRCLFPMLFMMFPDAILWVNNLDGAERK